MVRTMARALGSLGPAFRPGTRAARVFLERNPYVAWDAQRPAFQHPAFNGVVHPHLSHWGPVTSERRETDSGDETRSRAASSQRRRDERNEGDAQPPLDAKNDRVHPSEPTSESRSWLPRIARLAPMEANAMPEFHVQTVSGALCVDEDDARAFMRVASDVGAGALLFVTGDDPTGRTAWKRHGKTTRPLDSASLLRVANELRANGEIDGDISFAVAANPCLEASAGFPNLGTLEKKIQLGAEMIITQPFVVPPLARRWREAIVKSGLLSNGPKAIETVAGVSIPNSRASARRWMTLVFGDARETDARVGEDARRMIDDVLREWEIAETELDEETFESWIEERAELAVAEVLCGDDRFPFDGVHLMPVTAKAYRSARKVADAIEKLIA